ncbi:MAG: ABC transporter permease [Actinomycetota bacterium]
MRRGGMLGIVVRRLAVLPVVIVAVAAMTFAMVAVSPFDWQDAYATGERSLSPETAGSIAEVWNLEGPVHEQFGRWIANMARGDMGNSRLLGGQPVADQIQARLGRSALLLGTALLIALIGGLIAGVLAAVFRDGVWDWMLRSFGLFSVSSPSFWVGLLLIWVFSIKLGWLPPGGTSDLRRGSDSFELRYLILPAATLALTQLASFALFVRNQLLEVLLEDYVRFAQANGLGRITLVMRHALPNALLPFLTLAGANLADLVGGSVLVETVFGWPGLGGLTVQAARVVDLPLLLGITLAGSVFIVLGNLVADLSYRWADPRLRESIA